MNKNSIPQFNSIEEMLERYRQLIEKEKDYKYTKITIEELNSLNDELINLRESVEKLQKDNEDLEEKLKKARSGQASWASRYTSLEKRYEKIKEGEIDDIYEHLKKRAWDKLYRDADYEAKKKNNEFLSKEYSELQEKYKSIRTRFDRYLTEEKNRYEEKYDLEDAHNQGYLIGISKVRKEFLRAYDDVKLEFNMQKLENL